MSHVLVGAWLCLKNVHLVLTWLPMLDKAIRSLEPKSSFRLILTSEPHPAFPASLLEACFKVTHTVFRAEYQFDAFC